MLFCFSCLNSCLILLFLSHLILLFWSHFAFLVSFCFSCRMLIFLSHFDFPVSFWLICLILIFMSLIWCSCLTLIVLSHFDCHAFFDFHFCFAGVMVLAYSVVQSITTIKASHRLHQDMLTNVLRGPMSFFDTTPVGRIVNRFSQDIEAIDSTLPDNMLELLYSLFGAISVLVVICYSTPIFLVMILPLGIVYFLLQVSLCHIVYFGLLICSVYWFVWFIDLLGLLFNSVHSYFILFLSSVYCSVFMYLDLIFVDIWICVFLEMQQF